MRDYPLTLYTLSFPPCPPHKHIRVCGDPGRGNDKEVRAYRPQTYCTGLPQSYANVFNVDRTPHRNKKTPVGRFFISGADNRIISLCFITLQNLLTQTGALPFAFLRRFERLFRRFSSASLHRNKKRPLGAFYFWGG